MTDYNFSPFYACKLLKNNIMTFNWPEHAKYRTYLPKKKSKILPNLIHDTGTFYIYKTKSLIASKRKNLARSYHFINRKRAVYYLLDKLKSIDINTIDDFKFAEFLYKFNKFSKKT